jgi:hypothetical protein
VPDDRSLLPITDRRLAGALCVAMMVAVLAPIRQNWRQPPRDSFPLSYYPMFTFRRRKRHRERYFYGVDAHGGRVVLTHTCLGAGGLNQIRHQIHRAVRAGRAEELARAVAANVARRKGAPFDQVVRVQVVSGRYALDRYFAGDRLPHSERVLAVADVTRSRG